MDEIDHRITKQQSGTAIALWVTIIIYAIARVLQIYSGRVPMLVVVGLHVLPPIAFTLIHGARLYRTRGILLFVLICVAVGNIIENLSIVTGFPFGHYYFTSVMGPKILNVPVMLGLAYVGMGYLSWIMGLVILGILDRPLTRSCVVTAPLIAAFIMVAWDLAMDPVWGTILHAWIWLGGGAYFGVPITNFLGWYLTAYIIYQLFAIFARRRPAPPDQLPSRHWQLPVVFYSVSVAGNLLLAIPQTGPSVVSDAAGVQWRVSDITGTCALVSIFTMGAFACLASIRLIQLSARAEGGLAAQEGS